jgi:hypothetical protein
LNLPMAVAGYRRSATWDLTRVGLAVMPQRRRGRWLVTPVLVVAALAAGLGAGWALRDRVAAPLRPVIEASAELPALRQQLDQARLAARLSQARSQELEHQIDALNQQLTASQDELTFFRKAREGKH